LKVIIDQHSRPASRLKTFILLVVGVVCVIQVRYSSFSFSLSFSLPLCLPFPSFFSLSFFTCANKLTLSHLKFPPCSACYISFHTFCQTF
uniref:Ovule protein n=1 Tax=Brugia timori TaxID=42155 RepID=A0A0R3QA29_9BILA